MFSRILVGLQTSVLATLSLVVIITVVGTMVGVLCGYYGGILDAVVMRISDICLAFPGLVFALAIAALLNGGLRNAVLALAVISWPKDVYKRQNIMIQKLIANIQKTNAPIVVGLDPMLNYIPKQVQEKAFKEYGETLEGAAEAIWQFNKAIVDETYDIIPAVKPQIAMYEQFGIPGLMAYRCV